MIAVACFLPGRAKDLSAPPRNSETGNLYRTGFYMASAYYKITQKKHEETRRHVESKIPCVSTENQAMCAVFKELPGNDCILIFLTCF